MLFLQAEETTCCFFMVDFVVSSGSKPKQITNMGDLTISDSGAGDKPGTKPQTDVGLSDLGVLKSRVGDATGVHSKEPSAETCRGLLFFMVRFLSPKFYRKLNLKIDNR